MIDAPEEIPQDPFAFPEGFILGSNAFRLIANIGTKNGKPMLLATFTEGAAPINEVQMRGLIQFVLASYENFLKHKLAADAKRIVVTREMPK